MNKTALRLTALCLLVCLLLGTTAASASCSGYDFGFRIDEQGYTWGEWQRKSNGVNFRFKVHNTSYDEYVKGFTVAISAQDAYGDPILLKASDGCWYDTLWYESKTSYKPGRIAMSQYFYVQGDEYIEEITATIIRYNTSSGPVEIDPYDYDTRTWQID